MKILLSLLCAVLLSPALFAQDPAAIMPAPEELKAIDFLIGTYSTTDTVSGPDGSTENMKGKMVFDRALGSMFIHGKYSATGASFGDMSGEMFIGYDVAKKRYSGVWLDSMSSTPMVLKGSVSGDKVVLESEPFDPGSGPIELRFTFAKTATGLTFEAALRAGDTWLPMVNGIYERK